MEPEHSDSPHSPQIKRSFPMKSYGSTDDTRDARQGLLGADPFGSSRSPRDLPHYDNAVECRLVERSYGKLRVLKGVNMCCPVGAIYGLLGPSGCGKTTLLKCILGQLDIHGGEVKALGKRPGDLGHVVPGREVGYMPQDLALAMEFSVKESMQFYAKMHGISKEEFLERKDRLMRVLDLPNEDSLVRNLSGGQKRRVSLSCALINNPRLLILDEPTVGVDPVLRARIWEYLKDLVAEGVSVIITTHYIEEARNADRVGFMRNGRLLAEGKPEELMAARGKETLEETFLELCDRPADEDATAAEEQVKHELSQHPELHKKSSELNPPRQNICNSPPRCSKIGAKMWQGLIRARRNMGLIMFQFFLPALQVILFCLAIGANPTDIGLAVAQRDTGWNDTRAGGQVFTYGHDLLTLCRRGRAFDVKVVSSVEQGIDAVHSGTAWAVLEIPQNFTEALRMRIVYEEQSHDSDTLLLYMDLTNQQIDVFIEQEVMNRFEELIEQANLTDVKHVVPLCTSQNDCVPPIYGKANPKFTDFIAPGMIIAISFAQAIGLTAVGLVLDKKMGLLDREWSAGMRASELMLSWILNELYLLLVQIILLLFFAIVIFKLPMEGSIFLVLALSMALGLGGMVYGLVIASSTEDEQAANQLALGSFFPVLLLSGIIWPTEAIPQWLRYISYALPTTWAAEAMRAIMGRGWGMSHKEVWEGFVVTLSWACFFFLISVRSISNRSK